MNFWDIRKEADATRRETYGVSLIVAHVEKKDRTILVRRIFREPKPKLEGATLVPHTELTDEQIEERRERVSRLSKIVAEIGLDNCEEADVNIAGLIPPPVHVQLAPGDQPVAMCLLPFGDSPVC